MLGGAVAMWERRAASDTEMSRSHEIVWCDLRVRPIFPVRQRLPSDGQVPKHPQQHARYLDMKNGLALLGASILFVGASGCAAPGADSESEATPEAQPADFGDPGHHPQLPVHVFHLDYDLPVGGGRYLHVIEKFSTASLTRHDRHGLFMITGSLVNANQYDAVLDDGDVQFSALERAARHGYFAAAASFEGYDDSSHPDDGSVVTAERLTPELGTAIETFRILHGLPKVDLLAASVGASIAERIGGIASPIDPDHIGKIAVTSHVYKSVTPLFQQVFFSPEVHQLFLDAPNGYIQTAPPFYALILTASEPEMVDWANTNFPGTYATGPTLEGFDLPVFEADEGRADLLQFWGDQDPITPFSDVQQFQAEYGGHASYLVLPGGGHAPYYEPVREQFWTALFAFLDDD
jgi:hypothetical protein